MHASDETELREPGEFGELVRYTIAGWAGGIALGLALDSIGFQRSPWGQWLVRTLSGEGESLLEGLYAFRQRITGAAGSVAEAYGWGKLAGVVVPWVVDLASRLAGVDVYGVGGFYIPFFYAMSDQIGGNVSGLLYFRRRSPGWKSALARYFTHPVMVAGLVLIFLVPVGLLVVRIAGWSPTTQTKTAFETIVANLCWVPPLLGWLGERRQAAASG